MEESPSEAISETISPQVYIILLFFIVHSPGGAAIRFIGAAYSIIINARDKLYNTIEEILSEKNESFLLCYGN